jgi:hypothetical protein
MRRAAQGKYLSLEMTFLGNLTIGTPARRNADGRGQRGRINTSPRILRSAHSRAQKSVARGGGRNARFRCELESSLWRNNVPFSALFDRPRTLTIQFELVSELSALASRACVWLPPDAMLEQAPKHARVKHPKHIELHVKADIEKLEA